MNNSTDIRSTAVFYNSVYTSTTTPGAHNQRVASVSVVCGQRSEAVTKSIDSQIESNAQASSQIRDKLPIQKTLS